MVAMMLLAPLVLSGCAASGPVAGSDANGDVPRDFAVSVAVGVNDAGLEPAWYILEADGTLRAALGAPAPQSPVPPRVRTLTPGAQLSVWRAVQEARWIPQAGASGAGERRAGASSADTKDGGAPVEPAAPDELQAGDGIMSLAEVYVAAEGGRWSGRVREVPGSIGAQRLEGVIRELRRLAWLPTQD